MSEKNSEKSGTEYVPEESIIDEDDLAKDIENEDSHLLVESYQFNEQDAEGSEEESFETELGENTALSDQAEHKSGEPSLQKEAHHFADNGKAHNTEELSETFGSFAPATEALQSVNGIDESISSATQFENIESSQRAFNFSEEIDLKGKVEAIIFASSQVIKLSEIMDLLDEEEVTTKEVVSAIDYLIRFYEERGGGIRIVHESGMGFQFQTVKSASPYMEKMFSSRPRPLSRAAQETLAIVAYRQPVTRSDVEFIRGVDAGSIMKNLLERNLIECIGRREVAGRPMMFGTTSEFLKVYQLNSLADLPPLEAFQSGSNVVDTALGKLNLEQKEDIEDIISDKNLISNGNPKPSDSEPI